MTRLALAALLALAACAPGGRFRDGTVPMAVVPVDLDRYAGRWHEVARYPNAFEAGCVAATADYARNPDGSIAVTNICSRADGTREAVDGRAIVVAPGRLKVGFVPGLPAFGDYWVLHVEPDYSLAVVGAPSGSFGWVLARRPDPDPAAYARALAAFERNGYDLAGLQRLRP